VVTSVAQEGSRIRKRLMAASGLGCVKTTSDRRQSINFSRFSGRFPPLQARRSEKVRSRCAVFTQFPSFHTAWVGSRSSNMRRSRKSGSLAAGFRLQNGIVDDDRVGAHRALAGEIACWSENLGAAERMKGKQVGVAGDDQLRRAVDGKLKKLVVLSRQARTICIIGILSAIRSNGRKNSRRFRVVI